MPRHLKGFTLIEILVVLVIVGLVAGVALPRLYGISQRYEAVSQRKRLLSEIGNLGYRSYISGRPLVLASLPTAKKDGDPIDVPPGWRIEVIQPLKYSFNGICSGGTVKLVGPDASTEELQLIPPLCKPVTAR